MDGHQASLTVTGLTGWLSTAAVGLPRIWRTRTIPHPRASQKKRHAWRSSRYARYKIRRACLRHRLCSPQGWRGGFVVPRSLREGRARQGEGMRRSGPLQQGDRSRSLAARHRRGHAAQEPLAAQRDRGAGRRKGRAAARPVRGRAAGRLNGGLHAAKGRRGVGGSGGPARSRTRALQDPGHSALRRLQNVTPRNAARGTQKSSLRLGIGSYGSGGRLAPAIWFALAHGRGRAGGGAAAAAGVRPSSRQDSAPSRRAADAARLAAPPGRASRPPPPIPSSGIQCRIP